MVTAVAFAPDGSLLVTCSRDASVRFWAVSTTRGLPPHRPQTHAAPPRSGVAAALYAPAAPRAAPLGNEEPLELRDFSATEAGGAGGMGIEGGHGVEQEEGEEMQRRGGGEGAAQRGAGEGGAEALELRHSQAHPPGATPARRRAARGMLERAPPIAAAWQLVASSLLLAAAR